MDKNIIQIEKHDQSYETEFDGKISEIKLNGQNLMTARLLQDQVQKLTKIYSIMLGLVCSAAIIALTMMYINIPPAEMVQECIYTLRDTNKRIQYMIDTAPADRVGNPYQNYHHKHDYNDSSPLQSP